MFFVKKRSVFFWKSESAPEFRRAFSIAPVFFKLRSRSIICFVAEFSTAKQYRATGKKPTKKAPRKKKLKSARVFFLVAEIGAGNKKLSLPRKKTKILLPMRKNPNFGEFYLAGEKKRQGVPKK